MAGYLAGEMEHEQASNFISGICENQQLKNEYELMKNTWDRFYSNPAEKYKDTGQAWQILNRRLENDNLLEEHQPVVRIYSRGFALRMAAIALLILAVGIPVVYYSINQSHKSRGAIEYSSPEGILTVDLPDGSRVFLNEGANLQYNESPEKQREITLKGEGYFDVTTDKNRPFLVNTGKVTVTVLGTSFNIRESDSRSVEVFVESGSVKLELQEQNQSIILGPGQLGQADQELKISKLDDLNYLSWKTLDFKFIDESIEEIFRVLENAYHVEVRTGNIKNTGMRLTTSYSDQSFETILNTICTALDITYEKEGKVYILQPN